MYMLTYVYVFKVRVVWEQGVHQANQQDQRAWAHRPIPVDQHKKICLCAGCMCRRGGIQVETSKWSKDARAEAVL